MQKLTTIKDPSIYNYNHASRIEKLDLQLPPIHLRWQPEMEEHGRMN